MSNIEEFYCHFIIVARNDVVHGAKSESNGRS